MAVFRSNDALQIALDSCIDTQSVHYMQHPLAPTTGKSIPTIGFLQHAKLQILEGVARLYDECWSDTRGMACAEVDARSVCYLPHLWQSDVKEKNFLGPRQKNLLGLEGRTNFFRPTKNEF